MTLVPKPSRNLRKGTSSRRWPCDTKAFESIRVELAALLARADGAGPKQICSGEQPLAQCCLRSRVPPALRRSTRGGCTTQEDEQEPGPEDVEFSSPHARQRTANRCPCVRISMRRHAVHGCISTQAACTGRRGARTDFQRRGLLQLRAAQLPVLSMRAA